MQIVELGPDDPRLDEIYPVVHELRTDLSRDDFVHRYAAGHPDGYRVLALYDDGVCQAVAGYRVMVNFVRGRVLYVDDLVTTATSRSKGYGKALLDHLVQVARADGCEHVALDSGTQRTDAHRFYFREGFVVTSFHFGRPLT